MKVLFVSSANSGISPIVEAQGLSLQKAGIELSFYGVKGKGILGYLSNMSKLLRALRKTNPHVVHAHYSFCGIVSAIASRKPVVCSLMGSDVKSSGLWRMFINLFVKRFWAATIVKSEDMKRSLGLKCLNVIPNGVDIDMFQPIDMFECRAKLGWEQDKRVVLFAANPARPEKNYLLAEQAIASLNRDDVELQVVHGIKHNDMPTYLNAADVLLLTSLWEGSPNVVKEAMACNLRIVTTDVGDVAWLLEGTEGCAVTTHDPVKIAHQLDLALQYAGTSKCRERLITLGLDSRSVAQKILRVYEEVLKKSSPNE